MKTIISKLLILTGLFMSCNLFAVDIDSSTVINNSDFNTILYQDGKDFLKSVTVSSGELVKDGYQVMVAQQLVYAIQYLLVGIVGFVLLFFAYRIYSKGNADNKWNILTPTIILFVLSIPLLYVSATHIDIIVQGFVNPDYAAIKDIIELSKTLKLK